MTNDLIIALKALLNTDALNHADISVKDYEAIKMAWQALKDAERRV